MQLEPDSVSWTEGLKYHSSTMKSIEKDTNSVEEEEQAAVSSGTSTCFEIPHKISLHSHPSNGSTSQEREALIDGEPLCNLSMALVTIVRKTSRTMAIGSHFTNDL